MSLLMDALRKAEEAKKKAAQESQSEKAVVAEEQQPSAVVEKILEDAPAPKIELSMEAIEEVPARSVVPNIETTIEFEDEEDYVLPTSVAAATGSESDEGEDSNAEQSAVNTNEVRQEKPMDFGVSPAKLDPESAAENQTESTVEHVAIDFDSFESKEFGTSASDDEAALDADVPAVSNKEEPVATQSSRVVVKVAEEAGELSQKRAEPQRRTAQNVFAAKRSSLLANPIVKTSAGVAVVLVVVALSSYFYISLNQESAFNIPAGSYVATEFVDDGVISDLSGEQLFNNAVTVTEVEEAAAADVANVVIEPSAATVIAVPEPSRSAANLQPEAIVEEQARLDTVVTTIGDTPTVAIAPVPEPPAEPEAIAEEVQLIARVEVSPPAEPTNLISFTRQETLIALDPSIDRAYTAYQQGSLDQAEALYRLALTSDPMQRDALLGLATIAARNGNSTEALDLYSRLLARNPSDPIARAGLMDILPAGSPSTQEAELKRLLNDHPNVAALSYAYGNFLASNQRWSEAQQAYFRALQLAKSDAVVSGLVNPDYAFNLAVSLEHLNQSAPAQNYYREALVYSANHPAGFDLAALRSRLASTVGNSNNE